MPEYRLVAGAEWDSPFVRGLTLTGRFIYNGSQFVDLANTQEIQLSSFDRGITKLGFDKLGLDANDCSNVMNAARLYGDRPDELSLVARLPRREMVSG